MKPWCKVAAGGRMRLTNEEPRMSRIEARTSLNRLLQPAARGFSPEVAGGSFRQEPASF
jgi:hypothetical protein